MENPAMQGGAPEGAGVQADLPEHTLHIAKIQRAALPPVSAGSARKHQSGEAADNYPHIVARLSDRWRVIRCAGGIQWILQKRDAGNAPSTGWRGVSYCVTREALLRLCGGLESPIDPSAMVVLDRLPARIRVASDD